MSDSRDRFADISNAEIEKTASTAAIAKKLLNKPVKTTRSDAMKVRRSWDMHSYYATKENSLEDRFRELCKIVKILYPKVNKKQNEIDMLNEVAGLLEKIFLQEIASYEEKKETKTGSMDELLKSITALREKAYKLSAYLPSVEPLIMSLDDEYEEVQRKTKREVQLSSYRAEIEKIENEILSVQKELNDNRLAGKSSLLELAKIAELNESLSPFYEALGMMQEQLNVLLTARDYLYELPHLSRDQKALLQEIKETIEDVKERLEGDVENDFSPAMKSI